MLNVFLKSMETRDELSTTLYLNKFLLNKSYVKMPVSTLCYLRTLCYIRTSLPPEASSIFYYLELNSGFGLDTKRPVASLAEGGL